MKNMTLFRPLILLLAIVSFVSCDNEPLEGDFEASTPNNNNPQANFQVDIDGETFIADQSQVVTQNGVTLVTGIKANGSAVTMTITGNANGTYTLDSGLVSAGYAIAGETPYLIDDQQSATVEITDYNTTTGIASGTFSYTVTRTTNDENGEEITETLNLTNGEFTNVPLSTDENPGSEDTEFFINFTVAGQDYSFEAYTADSLKRLVKGDNENPDDFKGISLGMPLDVAEGTYQIVDPIGSDLEAYTAEYDSASDNLYLDAISGTIEITTLTDDYIEGTFNFSGEDESGNEIEITGGEFKAPVP